MKKEKKSSFSKIDYPENLNRKIEQLWIFIKAQSSGLNTETESLIIDGPD